MQALPHPTGLPGESYDGRGTTMAIESPHRFNVDEYYRMLEAGILTPDDRVELLDGVIVEMPPIGPAHGYSVDQLTIALMRTFAEWAHVRIQGPVRLDRHWEPVPDGAIM